MIEIVPAILPKDFDDLDLRVDLLRKLVPIVQIDICDGTLTPDPTWPYRKSDHNFEAILREDHGLPGWENLNFEIDLMVRHTEDKVLTWVGAGASRIVAHLEGTGNFQKVIDELESFVEIGLAIDLNTPIAQAIPFIDKIDFIQCMGISKIGYQGQPFDRRVIERVSDLRHKYPKLIISVDGGVNLKNAPALISAGANRLVVGSAIFDSADLRTTIKAFQKLGK